MELEAETIEMTPEEIDNPIEFENDKDCLKVLQELLLDPRFEEHELELIKKCIAVLDTKDGDPTEFDLSDLLDLYTLSENYLDKSDNIRACSDYLGTIIDYQFNLPDDIDPALITSLNKQLTDTYIALQSTLFGLSPSEFLDDDSDDEEEAVEEGEE
jgi:hypothetical protein